MAAVLAEPAGGEPRPAPTTHPLRWFLLVTLVSLLLYLPWLSIQYNPNGINEAVGVEMGGMGLFTPNHMLYRPLAAVVASMLARCGHPARAIDVLQATTAVCSALAIGFAFLAFFRLTGRPAAALAAAAFLATSTRYWACSVDAFYITPAALCVAGTLVVITGARLSPLRSALGGAVCALSILLWQANLLLVPGLACGIGCLKRREPARTGLLAVALFVGVAAGVTGLVYLGVGWLVFGHCSLHSFVDWTSHHAGGELPQWGEWSLNRLPVAAASALSSLIPVTHGVSLRGLVRGAANARGLLTVLSILALTLLVGLAASALLARPGRRERLRQLAWLAVAAATLVVFVVWWDPFEPKWFVIPNLFLAGMLACGWASTSRPALTLSVVFGCVLTIAVATFSLRIWPRRMHESPEIRRAACVASHMAERDLFIAVDLKWIAYLRYFYDRDAVSLIGLSIRAGGTEPSLDHLRQQVDAIRRSGASVYMIDPASYPPTFLAWFTSQTGLTLGDLERFEGDPAYTCDGSRFLTIRAIR